MTSRQMLLNKADELTEAELEEILEYIGIMESLRDQPGQAAPGDDSLLAVWALSVWPRNRSRQTGRLGVKGVGSLRV